MNELANHKYTFQLSFLCRSPIIQNLLGIDTKAISLYIKTSKSYS